MKKILFVVVVLFIVFGLGAWWVIQTKLFDTDKLIQNNSEVARVKKNGYLRVGTNATFKPMEYLDDNGKIIGHGPDLALELANAFGVRLKIINIEWSKIFDELDNGNIDLIISSVTINTERSKKMSFSKPYLNAGQVIVVKSDDILIKGLLDLKDKKIGVQSETTSGIEAAKYTDNKNVIEYIDYDAASIDLLSGKIDAIIMDYPPAVEKVKNNSNLKLVGGPFTQEFYGVVVAKGRENLLIPINRVIEKMLDSGEMKKLENKWLK